MKLHLRESKEYTFYSWDELTPDQQNYVIDNWADIRKLCDAVNEIFSEDMTMFYEENKQEICNKYEQKYKLNINPDKLYWNSSSQGPYPEWDLSDVFDAWSDDIEPGVEVAISFYGKGTTVNGDVDVSCYDTTNPFYKDDTVEFKDINKLSLDKRSITKINMIIHGAQAFINEFWNYIYTICTGYPDDEWVRGLLEGNPEMFEFYIRDGKVCVL